MPYKDLKKRNLSATARRRALATTNHGELPKGFVPVKVTTDHAGRVTAVQSRPKGPAKQVFDVQLQGQHVKGISTLLDGEGNVSQQWIKTDTQAAKREELALAALDSHMARYRGAAEPVARGRAFPSAARDLQVSILMGDPHFGMLSWHLETGADFDLKIAEQHMSAAVDLLFDRVPDAQQCVIANLGDFLHANDDTAATPRGGNRLDVDSRFSKTVDLAFGVMRRVIDRARARFARVIVVNVPGNHDPVAARMLVKWLQAVYEACPEVEIVPNTNPYIFLEFGLNLTMYCHGDGAKPEQCPAIMAAWQDGKPWGRCPHREIQGGHVHHMTRKEFPGVVFETSRTTAPADYWHHWKGYRAGRGMRAVVHHAELGRLSEHQVGVKEVELLLRSRKPT